MWSCCLPKNEDNAIEQSEKGVNEEDIIDDRSNKFYVDFKELIEGYENNRGEYIDMSQPPRDDSYNKMFSHFFTSAAKHQDSVKNESFDPYGYRTMPTEMRGITLRQLRAILPLIKRRCKEEKWTRSVYNKKGKETKKKEEVTLETATMYEINTYIIKPFTEFSQKSFVETLPSTKGIQPPRWFVSHYWGETFVNTMACLECLVQDFEDYDEEEHDKGMTEDTPLWICSFANNQHNLESDLTDDPTDTSFAKAMKIANFHVISILDVNHQVYTQLWCMYELYLVLLLSRERGIDGILAIYTFYEHENDYDGMRKAVGLVEGGAISDWEGYEIHYDRRQKHFPLKRLFPFLTVSIQNAKASWDEDRKHILNSLVGRKGADLDLEPLHMHENYDKLNDAMRGAVFSSQVILSRIYETGKKRNWKSALSALEKSIAKEFTIFRFQRTLLTNKEALAQVFYHLPNGLEKLIIFDFPYGRLATMDTLLDWLENKSTILKTVYLRVCIGGEVGGKEFGERLATFLTRDDCKIEEINLLETDLVGSRNVDTWIECLEINRSLKRIEFSGMANWKKNGKIYSDGTNFLDATLSTEQYMALKKTVSKFEKDDIDHFILEDSDREESTSN